MWRQRRDLLLAKMFICAFVKLASAIFRTLFTAAHGQQSTFRVISGLLARCEPLVLRKDDDEMRRVEELERRRAWARERKIKEKEILRRRTMAEARGLKFFLSRYFNTPAAAAVPRLLRPRSVNSQIEKLGVLIPGF